MYMRLAEVLQNQLYHIIIIMLSTKIYKRCMHGSEYDTKNEYNMSSNYGFT